MEIFSSSFFPSFVLLLSSGVLGNLLIAIHEEYRVWSQKYFAFVIEAYGGSIPETLRNLVLIKTYFGIWSRSLPWLFGELVVVECIFNAPGLGLDAWNMARVRDYPGLFGVLIWLSALYGICAGGSLLVNRWIGRRLDGYS
ncbi:MAG: hypothetical protein HQK54_10145 [Oligoflexales bacterium]|nr:hypothetical protein [Oligoflexales bacterium]